MRIIAAENLELDPPTVKKLMNYDDLTRVMSERGSSSSETDEEYTLSFAEYMMTDFFGCLSTPRILSSNIVKRLAKNLKQSSPTYHFANGETI